MCVAVWFLVLVSKNLFSTLLLPDQKFTKIAEVENDNVCCNETISWSLYVVLELNLTPNTNPSKYKNYILNWAGWSIHDWFMFIVLGKCGNMPIKGISIILNRKTSKLPVCSRQSANSHGNRVQLISRVQHLLCAGAAGVDPHITPVTEEETTPCNRPSFRSYHHSHTSVRLCPEETVARVG